MNESNNTLKAWATGKLAMFAIGLAVGYFIYKSGLIQKLTGKLLSSKSSESSE